MFEWLFNKRAITSRVPKLEVMERSISLLVIMEMEQYIQENQEFVTHVNPEGNEYNQLSLAYNELVSVGLSNTKNARLIKKRMDAMVESSERIVKANELLRFAKELRTHFGETTLLIGTAQFEKLCKKYNLSIGTIGQYTGTIPDKNLRELQRTITKVGNFRGRLNNTNLELHMCFVEGIEYDTLAVGDSEVRIAKEWVRENRVINSRREPYANGTVYLSDVIDCNPNVPTRLREYRYCNLIRLKCSPVIKETMFIACPADQLKVQPLKIVEKATDPIVFQYSPYGIIIHTMWGEESEDIVIEEYKRLNNLMNL